MRFIYPLFFVLFAALPGRAAESFEPINGRSYYQVLGVGVNATADELKLAFRSRMKALHPDVVNDPSKAAETLAESQNVSLVYSVLKDPVKRRRYDLYWLPAANKAQNGAQSASGGEWTYGADSRARDSQEERNETLMQMIADALERIRARFQENPGLSTRQLAFIAQQTYLYNQRYLADTAVNADDAWFIFDSVINSASYSTSEIIGLAGGAIEQMKERANQGYMAASANDRLWQVRNRLLRDLNNPYHDGNTAVQELWTVLTGSYYSPAPPAPQPASTTTANGNSASCERVLRGQVRGSDGRLYDVEIPIRIDIKIGF